MSKHSKLSSMIEFSSQSSGFLQSVSKPYGILCEDKEDDGYTYPSSKKVKPIAKVYFFTLFEFFSKTYYKNVLTFPKLATGWQNCSMYKCIASVWASERSLITHTLSASKPLCVCVHICGFLKKTFHNRQALPCLCTVWYTLTLYWGEYIRRPSVLLGYF